MLIYKYLGRKEIKILYICIINSVVNITLKSEYYPLMRDKIGNMLIYFCQKEEIPLSIALKLLFLVDETSVKESGVPITFIDYFAYERGPVAHDVYYVLKTEERKLALDNSIKLSSFIRTYKSEETRDSKSHYRIKPIKEFDDLDFSDYEMEIIQRVVKIYGNKSSTTLSNLTHEENSLWDKVSKANNLDSYLKLNECKHSDFPVHFTSLIDTDSKKRAYQNAKSSLEDLSKF